MTRARRGEGEAQAQMGDARCKVCRAKFRYRIKQTDGVDAPPPPICGQLPCRARHDWRSAEWAGRARMAGARQRAGVELDDLDLEALARQGSAAA